MIDIARNIVPCSDKQDMKSRNGSYFQPSFSTRKRQRISSDLFSELPQKRSKTTIGRIWNKATYFYSSQTLCTIFSKVIRMWASFRIFEKERPGVPMRVDHGRMMLGDTDKGYNPGYSFHGRMMALAQIEGMMAVVNDESKLES